MASSTVDAAVLQRTKDTLGKVIKKPPLTDKLLSRPPFRYLHDIIVEVTRRTHLTNSGLGRSCLLALVDCQKYRVL